MKRLAVLLALLMCLPILSSPALSEEEAGIQVSWSTKDKIGGLQEEIPTWRRLLGDLLTGGQVSRAGQLTVPAEGDIAVFTDIADPCLRRAWLYMPEATMLVQFDGTNPTGVAEHAVRAEMYDADGNETGADERTLSLPETCVVRVCIRIPDFNGPEPTVRLYIDGALADEYPN